MKERWRGVWEIYAAAADLLPEERQRFVQSCECSPETQSEVLALLRELEQPSSPLPIQTFIPTKSSRYVLLEELGRGGMGRVFAAQDTELDRIVAMKFLSPAALADTSTETLVYEAKAASALNHPNIVTVHEVIESEAGLAIVMEMVEGTPLRSLIGTPIPVAKLIHLGTQAAEALAEAHSRGIIHRDVKPENIVARQDGYIKLLDFGLACRLDTGPNSSGRLTAGTLRYMSPEQARGDVLTPASDIFSLGVVLYELTTGVHPFEAASPLEVVHRVATAKAIPPSDLSTSLPASLSSLLLAMLHKVPEQRPSARDVATMLQRIGSEAGPRVIKGRPGVIAAMTSILGIAIGMFIFKNYVPSEKVAMFRQITTAASENRVTAAALGPDGGSFLFADAAGAVHWRDIKTGETRVVCSIPDSHLNRLAWFSNGSTVLLSGFAKSTQRFVVWQFSIRDGKAEPLRYDAAKALPSPSGKEIAFINSDGSEIKVKSLSGGDERRIAVDSNRGAFQTVLWSPDGRRLSYMRRRIVPRRDPGDDLSMDSPDVESSYETADVSSAEVLGKQPANGLSMPAALPDGRVLFVRQQHSSYDLVEVQTDRLTGRFLSKARKITPLSSDELTTGFSVTPDGRGILAVLIKARQSDVYVGTIEPKTVRLTHVERLTLNTMQDYPHAWLHDSKTVIFESNRNGDWQIFSQCLGQNEAEGLTHGSQWDALPQVSPDGRWILYLHHPRYLPSKGANASKRVWTVMRVAASGGQPESVPGAEGIEEFQCAGPGGRRCVLRALENNQFIFYDLDPLRGKGKELTRIPARRNIFADWGVSPDGRFVALPDHDSFRCAFRVIDLEHAENPIKEVTVDAIPVLTSVAWATGRPGWYIAAQLAAGIELRYVDERGHSQRLWETAIPTWPVPSPDGRQLAFVDGGIDSNVWMLER